MARIFPIFLLLTVIFFITATATIGNTGVIQQNGNTDSLPNVFNKNQGGLVENRLRHEAVQKFSLYQLPQTKNEWNKYKTALKNKIIKKTGALVNQHLPLNLRETGSLKQDRYTIKNIAFQTRPGIYATANLYIPDGEGKFAGVVVMMGHSAEGKLYDKYQSVGITLALNGYVSLCIDPWGSGERTTIHGVLEDHGDGNNLGSALLNIGQPLMGMLITDNIRGVDLLSSLPYVDAQNIGATGSSGGGNQTMWLAAMDERIKAAVPVVSAGTFESYVMRTPCICEVLVDGLTFTEEAGVLGLIAPRAIKMCNHSKDDLATFNPREMLRSYKNAKPIFKMMGAEGNIAYDTFDLAHGYWPQDREAMLGWFNLHLTKIGNGAAVKELPFNTIPAEQLMVYAKNEKAPQVISTAAYCKKTGDELRKAFLNTKSFNATAKRNELKDILKVNEASILKTAHQYPIVNGWNRFALETSDNKLIPVLLRVPSENSKEFVIVADAEGKQNISTELIEAIIKSGSGIAIVDLSGTGEISSLVLNSTDSVGRLRTLLKSYLWLGKTPLGEWVKELNVVAEFIRSKFKPTKISFNGNKEAGLAGLFLAAWKGNIENVTLRNVPVSYLFDDRESVEFFSAAIYLPGFLNWGDVSLAAALVEKNITFINPLTMSGRNIKGDELQTFRTEFEQMKKTLGKGGRTVFKF
ncbi:MAG: acetylxylan esterase [Ferruginibacter sp.]